MFDFIIRISLKHAWLVVAAAALLVGVGLFETSRMPLDVLPELSAPSVTVVTEANGLAPEEVEKLVTVPLEQALNGSTGLRRIRSSSAVGISLIWAGGDGKARHRASLAARWHRADDGARILDHGRDHVRRRDGDARSQRRSAP
jgi:hypothetical protein